MPILQADDVVIGSDGSTPEGILNLSAGLGLTAASVKAAWFVPKDNITNVVNFDFIEFTRDDLAIHWRLAPGMVGLLRVIPFVYYE